MQAPDFFDLFFWRFEQVLRHTSVQKVLEICQAFLWIRAAAFTALPPSKHLFCGSLAHDRRSRRILEGTYERALQRTVSANDRSFP